MIRKNFKQLILAFVKPLLWAKYRSVYKAIEIVLSPCCDLTGVGETSCNDDNTYAITITTNESIGFLGKGVATLVVDGTSLTGVVTEPNTIYVETAALTAGTYDVTVTIFLPTNTNADLGAFKTFTVVDVVFDSCV